MKKIEAQRLAPVRSKLIIEYITQILSDQEKVSGTMTFNTAKIEGQNMLVLDIYVPKRNFEKHLNLGITSAHDLVLYEQLLNDLLDTFLEHESIGVSKYYSLHSMNGFFSGINAVNILESKIMINLNARGQDFDEVIARYTKRYDLNKELLKRFPITKGNEENPYIILFDAYTGMGKSTVARLIASIDGSIILNNDEVRSYLKDYESRDIKYFQRMLLKGLLENKNSCIMDSCFCHNYEEKLKFYKELGYKYYIVKLECEEEIIKERLEKRVLDGINFSIANYQDYLWMKQNVPHVPNELVDFTINTAEELEPQATNLLRKINK